MVQVGVAKKDGVKKVEEDRVEEGWCYGRYTRIWLVRVRVVCRKRKRQERRTLEEGRRETYRLGGNLSRREGIDGREGDFV